MAKSRVSIGTGMYSTEPQAREVLDQIRESRQNKAEKPEPAGDSGIQQGDQTASNPAGIKRKTEAEGQAELEAIRKKRRERKKKSGAVPMGLSDAG